MCVTESTADLHGPRWGARAGDWAELVAELSRPAWVAIADLAAVGEGTRVLDVGCGSGEFCVLAAERGAEVAGIDAAAGMLAVARERVPAGEFREGPMEELPWPDASFDVVTGFNAFQFAADTGGALAEAARVCRPGGVVAVCVWSRPEESEQFAVMRALADLQPPSASGPSLSRPLAEPGAAAAALAEAGLEVVDEGEVDVPFAPPDRDSFVRGMLTVGAVQPAIEHSGEEAVRAAIAAAGEPFRRDDGSYLMRNRYRYAAGRRAA